MNTFRIRRSPSPTGFGPAPTYCPDSTWRQWLVDDQRYRADRTDVLVVYDSGLTRRCASPGQPDGASLRLDHGTDADWVVKLIDVYPAEVPGDAELGSYELPIAMDIMRGRFATIRQGQRPFRQGESSATRSNCPTPDHVFLPGHRIMIQIQSSWFPLYDRNPQTFVPNIFFAKPVDYVKATQRVFHKPDAASYVDLPVAR